VEFQGGAGRYDNGMKGYSFRFEINDLS